MPNTPCSLRPLKRASERHTDHTGSPSTEASNDPTPTEPSLESGDAKSEGVNTYVATKPYRSKKGDRFS